MILGLLQQVVQKYRSIIILLENGGDPGGTKKKDSIEKNKSINENWNRYRNGELNINELFNICSNLIGQTVDTIEFNMTDYETGDKIYSLKYLPIYKNKSKK